MMNKTTPVTISLPTQLDRKIEKQAGSEYLNVEEFIRSSVLELVLKSGMLKQRMLVNYFVNVSKTKHIPFDERYELAALKKTRNRVWQRYHGKSGS